MSGDAPARHRFRKAVLWVLGLLFGVPATLVLLVLLVANIGPGRRLIEQQVGRLTGGTVVMQGLAGRFPDALRLAHLDIRDGQGAWLKLDGVTLDWSPSALLGRTARIDRLSADRVTLARLPAADRSATAAPPSTGGFSLPVSVDLRALRVARLDLGAPVAGTTASLSVGGSGHFTTLADALVAVSITRLDGAGSYHLDARVEPASVVAHLVAAEPAGGLVADLAGLPALGGLALDALIDGPRGAERTRLSLSAGPLKAGVQGLVDLAGQSAAVDVSITAPAMAPRPDLSWSSIDMAGHVKGPFATPDVTAHAVLQNVRGGGAAVGTLAIDASGNRGTLDVHGVLTGLTLPPPDPNLFAAAPLDLTLHADLDKPGLPLRFAVRHPLVMADGTATSAGDIAARVHTVVPDLAPLAAIGHLDIQGRTEAVASLTTHGAATDVTVDGTASFTGGQAPLPTLLGRTAFGVTARLNGQDLTVTRAIVDGRAAHAAVTGTDIGGRLALAWRLALTDLTAASPRLSGALRASGRLDGPRSGLAVQADITGDVGTASVPRGPITLAVRATGLPANPAGTIEAQGRLAGSPLSLRAAVDRQPGGALHVVLTRADWKSLAAAADLTLAQGEAVPTGTLSARMTRLADFAPLIGQSIAGSLDARLTTSMEGGKPDARIALRGADIDAGGAALARLSLTGHVRDPAGRPDAALVLTADGLDASGVTGAARVTLDGPQGAFAIASRASLVVSGTPATLAADARLDIPARRVLLHSLTASSHDETLHLSAPASFDFGRVTGVDRLRLSLVSGAGAPASLDIAGQIAPTLALTAALRNVTPALAQPFAPSLQAAGTLTADARLTGTMAAPQGSVQLHGSGIRARSGPAASLPAATFQATIGLDGNRARLDARLSAGPRLTLASAGSVPLQAGGDLALRTTGAIDLALLDPVLGATGQRAAGQVALDATVGGSISAPRLAGALTLAGGEIQDFVRGVRVNAITARLVADGDSVRIARLTARAGAGTLGATGTVGVLAPGLPVDLHLTADHARPLASDLLTATLDADLAVHGQAAGALAVSGSIFVRRADINIPNALPPSVAVLTVRRPGDRPPPPPGGGSASVVDLALTVDAPSNIFVRGHGVDAELGGRLTVAGASAAPQIGGGFQLRTGSFSVAGTTLTFSKGEVGFDGSGVGNKIDPTLDFVADSTSGSVTATLTVGGYADAPKITLSSTPSLPQDEVLAHLLFGESVKDLSALQIAEIASALADLSGVTGGGGDPLGAVRRGLGLDRLSVGGGGGSGSGATVEAGRYVARGVYVGARQATSGGGTAAEVQVDITRRLKAKAQLATGGGTVQGSTPDNDQGSTLGLSYQFDY